VGKKRHQSEDNALPNKWLQVKGDPSVRAFLFQQERAPSLFDEHLDSVHRIVHELLCRKGVFHLKVHYSSSQLTCWLFDDPYRYHIYVREEVCRPGFLDRFPDFSYEGRQPLITKGQIAPALAELRRLRLTDSTIYLRNASINRMNGMIGMTFSCDGSHYIDYETFFNKLEHFGTPENTEAPAAAEGALASG
jgi:hypothetical protein